MPPMMVAPDRETPGTSASTWHRPTPKARLTGMPSTACTVGAGRSRSTTSITTPPATKATPMTTGL